MNWKARFGIDGFDLLVHLAVTALVMTMVGSIVQGADADPIMAGVVCVSVVVLSFRRRRALAAESAAGEEASSRLSDLEERMGELEVAHQRIYELEERLDFAERLLVRQREGEAARLDAGEPRSPVR